METTTSLKTFEVTIPEKYADILKKFITSLEGKVKAQKKSGLDEALEDVKAGRIYHAESTKDLMKQILGYEIFHQLYQKVQEELELCQKRGYDMNLFEQVSNLLETTGSLPSQYHPHRLSGKYAGLWECHIQGDWLLIWSQDDTELILLFTDTGTHSDLF